MKSYKRIISIALALVLMLALCSSAFAIGNAEITFGNTPTVIQPVVKANPFITDDHFAYITGYPDGSFKPDGGLSRAEAATIFYRLLKDKKCDVSPVFSDVKKGSWYYKAVTTLAGLDVIDGYLDGSFKPNEKVSRAEFLKMAASFFDLQAANVKFTDVQSGKWYYKYIASAVAQGWIDNLAVAYMPDADITRAEVVAIMNNIIGREADAEFIVAHYADLNQFSDVDLTDSCFLDVVEAANAHDFKLVSGAEVWTALRAK